MCKIYISLYLCYFSDDNKLFASTENLFQLVCQSQAKFIFFTYTFREEPGYGRDLIVSTYMTIGNFPTSHASHESARSRVRDFQEEREGEREKRERWYMLFPAGAKLVVLEVFLVLLVAERSVSQGVV